MDTILSWTDERVTLLRQLWEDGQSASKIAAQLGGIGVLAAQLLAPMVPHLAEDVWKLSGGTGLAVDAPWPIPDPAALVQDSVTLPIQINGKRRGEITVPAGMAQAEIEQAVLADEAVRRHLNGQAPRKLIVVPGRIVNVVA